MTLACTFAVGGRCLERPQSCENLENLPSIKQVLSDGFMMGFEGFVGSTTHRFTIQIAFDIADDGLAVANFGKPQCAQCSIRGISIYQTRTFNSSMLYPALSAPSGCWPRYYFKLLSQQQNLGIRTSKEKSKRHAPEMTDMSYQDLLQSLLSIAN